MGVLIPPILFAAENDLDMRFNLGRLFFSPLERDKIDQRRHRSPNEIAQEKAQKIDTIDIPQWVRVDGIVIRKQHANVVWINGKQNSTQPGLRIRSQHLKGIAVPMDIINSDKQVTVKPGQQVDTRNGQISENFQKRAVASP